MEWNRRQVKRDAAWDRNLVFGSRSRTSASRFGFAVERDSRPAWSEIGGILKGRQQLSWRFHAGADAFWAFWGGGTSVLRQQGSVSEGSSK
jgi:hypothetical protein